VNTLTELLKNPSVMFVVIAAAKPLPLEHKTRNTVV
jgi:hypothetical protein